MDAADALSADERRIVRRVLTSVVEGVRTYADMLENMDDEIPAHQAMRIYADQLDTTIAGIKTAKPN